MRAFLDWYYDSVSVFLFSVVCVIPTGLLIALDDPLWGAWMVMSQLPLIASHRQRRTTSLPWQLVWAVMDWASCLVALILLAMLLLRRIP